MIVLRVYEDLRYAVRLIVGNGTSTLAVFLSLTLGIAASTSMFGAVDAFLLRPIPVPQTDRILRITSVNQSSAVGDVSYLNFADLRQRATKFEALVSSHNIGIALDVHNGAQSRITLGQAVSADFFPMLRLPLTIGRGFRPEEDAVPGRDALTVISYSMWQRDFGGNADAVGKTIQINRNDFTIIGVAPREFRGVHSMIHPDLYVPRMMAEVLADPGVHPLTDRTMATVEVYGRLKPGAGVDEARAEVERIGAQLEQENPATNRKQSLAVYTQTGFAVTEDPEAFSAGILFLFIGALVLGIACVNVANLLLSLAPARTRETAVRLAMGAPRSRLIRQFVIESCIVSTAATAAGIGVSALVARFVRSLEIGTSLLPVTLDMRIDTRVALFAFGVGMGSGILSAIIPAVRCSRGNLNLLMRSADPRMTRSRTPLRQLLVSAQVAFAAVVLVFAIGAIHSLSKLRKADPGFRVDNVITIAIDAKMGRGLSPIQAHRYYEQVLDNVRRMSGVQAVGLGHHVPLGLLSTATNVAIEGVTPPEGERDIHISSTIIGDGYFTTLNIPILRGRSFDSHDTADSSKVAIINEAMAQKYWPGRDALGARIELHTPTPATAQVVGIARTTKYRELEESPLPFMYLPMNQTEETFMWVMVATQGDASPLITPVRDAIRQIGDKQPIYDVHLLSDTVRRQALWAEIMGTQIATGAGVIALLLGLLGLYGLLSYSVSQRTREIGIRMAVGATSGRVSRMIVFQGLKLSIAGIIAGIILAVAASAAIPELSSPGDTADQIIYGIVAVMLLAATLLSCYYPARRAARIDPNECLRCE